MYLTAQLLLLLSLNFEQWAMRFLLPNLFWEKTKHKISNGRQCNHTKRQIKQPHMLPTKMLDEIMNIVIVKQYLLAEAW